MKKSWKRRPDESHSLPRLVSRWGRAQKGSLERSQAFRRVLDALRREQNLRKRGAGTLYAMTRAGDPKEQSRLAKELHGLLMRD